MSNDNKELKLELNEKEKRMYETIKEMVENSLTKKEAAEKLGVSVRTIYRALEVYLACDMSGFVHGLRGHRPRNALDIHVWEQIQSAYEQRYLGYNFSHFREKYIEEGGIDLPYSTYYNILTARGFISPKAQKRKKKSIHPLRERREGFGEVVQMDASYHRWFGNKKCHLHIAVDDATSKILGAYFDTQETLKGYYNVFKQILLRYGVPSAFYTDRRTIFEYRRKNDYTNEDVKNALDNSRTQFAIAARTLGVNRIFTTSVPQAKGRVERSFNTHQDRLVNEMKTANIKTIDEANIFLQDYIKRHNKKFALPSDNLKNKFKEKPSLGKINTYLAITSIRHILSGMQIKYNGKIYVPYLPDGTALYIKEKTEVIILKTFDNKILMGIDDFVVPLLELRKGKLIQDNNSLEIPKNLQFNERRYHYNIAYECKSVA